MIGSVTNEVMPQGVLGLEQVVATLGVYPLAQTTVIPVLMRMTTDLATETSELARALGVDPAIAAKVLRLCNSTYYGRRRQVSSLSDAVTILGFYTIRSIVVAASASSLFRSDHTGGLEHKLWDHSLAVAMAARIVAREVGSRQEEEEVYLIGLLHDIGKLVLLQKFPDVYIPILREGVEGEAGHLIVESAKLGFSHADLGAIILEQWGFPPRMAGVIHRYHIPDLPFLIRGRKGIEEIDLAMGHMVCFAHETANALGYGFEEYPDIDLSALTSTEYLGLTPTAITRICQELNERFAEEKTRFED